MCKLTARLECECRGRHHVNLEGRGLSIYLSYVGRADDKEQERIVEDAGRACLGAQDAWERSSGRLSFH